MANVPNVTEGLPLLVATDALQMAPDIVPGELKFEHHPTIPFGHFIRFSHTGTVPNGTLVDVFQSLGPDAAVITIPAVDFEPEDVLGKPLRKALKDLKSNGWMAHEPIEVEAPGMRGNRIVEVRRHPGTRKVVDLRISKKRWYER